MIEENPCDFCIHGGPYGCSLGHDEFLTCDYYDGPDIDLEEDEE